METTLHYIQFNEIGITFAVIASALAFVVLAWNAVKAILDWRALAKKPTDERIDDHERRIDDHERRIDDLEKCCEEVRGKLQSDWKFQQDEVEMNRLMLRSIKQLMKHALDGDDVDGLKNMEKEVDDYLVDHQR